jgi:hypothetical protein
MDEFTGFTPDAKAGVLHVRELTDDVVMTIARDAEWETPEFRAVSVFMDSLKGEGDRPTNPMWIIGTALDVAFERGLIDGEQFDHYRREAGL